MRTILGKCTVSGTPDEMEVFKYLAEPCLKDSEEWASVIRLLKFLSFQQDSTAALWKTRGNGSEDIVYPSTDAMVSATPSFITPDIANPHTPRFEYPYCEFARHRLNVVRINFGE